MSKVTIIIPSYNHANYLKQRLDSIYNQSFKDWEAIIIDDASTDNSISVIESYLNQNKDFKIKHFIKNTSNSGSGYKSWQKGIALAETEFIWIAETDDFSQSDFLKFTVEALNENPEAVLAFTASNYVDEQGDFLYNTDNRFAKLKLKENETKVLKGNALLNDLPLNPLITNGSSVVFKKLEHTMPDKIFEQKQLSDLFLWTYLLRDNFFIIINRPLNYFRRHEASTTTINYKSQNDWIYKEYSNYANYFELKKSSQKKIVTHYIHHFLLPNRKKIGYFNMQPLKELNKITLINKLTMIVKGYFIRLIKR